MKFQKMQSRIPYFRKTKIPNIAKEFQREQPKQIFVKPIKNRHIDMPVGVRGTKYSLILLPFLFVVVDWNVNSIFTAFFIISPQLC